MIASVTGKVHFADGESTEFWVNSSGEWAIVGDHRVSPILNGLRDAVNTHNNPGPDNDDLLADEDDPEDSER